MRLTDTHIWILTIIGGFLTGFLFNSLYGFFQLATATGLSFIVVSIVSIIELFIKGNRFFRIAGFLFFFFLFSSITSFVTLQLIYNSQKECSEKMILLLNNFYKTQNQFPQDINILKTDKATKQKFLKHQHYKVDTSRQSFSISFNVDGATTYTFNSMDKTWMYDGFGW